MAKHLSPGKISRYLAESDRPAIGSNYDAMAELTLSLSHTSVRCRACAGSGVRELSREDLESRGRQLAREKTDIGREHLRRRLSYDTVCRACRGIGWTTQKRADRAAAMDSFYTTVHCSKCRATGETLEPNDESAEIGDVCTACGDVRGALDSVANGFFVPVTVKPIHGPQHGGGGSATDDDENPEPSYAAGPDEDAMAERARVGRELDAVRRSDPAVGAAIDSYFGTDGAKWGSHKWGRVFALWQHTKAGRQIAQESAEKSRRGHGFLIAPLDLIAAERDAEFRAEECSTHRRALLRAADTQARELLRRVQAVMGDSEAA
jgi:hypothetical protein